MAFPITIQLDALTQVGKAVPLSADSAADPFGGGFAVRVIERVPGAVASPLHAGQEGEYVVAYSSVCTHMGCRLASELRHQSTDGDEQLLIGPCPCHGTMFDLLRSGLVVLGPATQHLPQLRLELTAAGDGLHAVGWLGDPEPKAEDWPRTPHP